MIRHWPEGLFFLIVCLAPTANWLMFWRAGGFLGYVVLLSGFVVGFLVWFLIVFIAVFLYDRRQRRKKLG